jgi:glycosyltransferase involved in cell wall biosynthesis
MLLRLRPPKITVCIPTYNQARYLGDAIRSALAQTEADFELVVYDDASTDETPAVIASFQDPRIRSFRQTQNVGIARNRNSCVSVARGRYLAWLDGDDVYRPNMLALQAAVLDGDPRVGLVHGNHDVIGDDGRALPDWEPPFRQDTVERGEVAFRELMLANYITAPTVLIRRECYDCVGGYAQELSRSGEDWELWLRVALHFDIAYTSARVASYRQHAESSSNGTVASGVRVRLDIAAIKRVFDPGRNLPIPDRNALRRSASAALAVKALVHAGSAFVTGNRTAALRSAVQAFRQYPLLARRREAGRLLLSILTRDEYANYRHTKSLLAVLHRSLDGSRFADRIRKLSVSDPAWEQCVRDVAGIVKRRVPPGAQVAIVDKHDPTLLHLCGRSGWHFPDLRSLPTGYPTDSEEAVEHLEMLRRKGARYLVFPNHAYWWLEHYDGLARQLETSSTVVWDDDRCQIYELAAPVAS